MCTKCMPGPDVFHAKQVVATAADLCAAGLDGPDCGKLTQYYCEGGICVSDWLFG